MDHKGDFQKGYINYSPETGLKFTVRRNARSIKVDFSVPLPYFKQHWTTLLGDDILFPVHSTVSSFLRLATSDKIPPHSTMYLPNTFFPHVHPLSVNPLIPQTLTDKSGWIRTRKKSKVLSTMRSMQRSRRTNI